MTHRHTQIIRALSLLLCGGITVAASTMPAHAESLADSQKAAVSSPFQIHLTGTVSGGIFCGATYTVPAGTRVHLKYVGFRGSSNLSGQNTLGGEVDVLVNSTTAPFQTYLNPLQGVISAAFGGTYYEGGQQIVAEANAGSAITVGYYFSQSDSGLFCEVGMSGQMETIT